MKFAAIWTIVVIFAVAVKGDDSDEEIGSEEVVIARFEDPDSQRVVPFISYQGVVRQPQQTYEISHYPAGAQQPFYGGIRQATPVYPVFFGQQQQYQPQYQQHFQQNQPQSHRFSFPLGAGGIVDFNQGPFASRATAAGQFSYFGAGGGSPPQFGNTQSKPSYQPVGPGFLSQQPGFGAGSGPGFGNQQAGSDLETHRFGNTQSKPSYTDLPGFGSQQPVGQIPQSGTGSNSIF